MIVKPYKNRDKEIVWYRIPRSQDPDKLLTLFLLGKGEFSALSQLAFEEQLQKRLENRKLIYA